MESWFLENYILTKGRAQGCEGSCNKIMGIVDGITQGFLCDGQRRGARQDSEVGFANSCGILLRLRGQDHIRKGSVAT